MKTSTALFFSDQYLYQLPAHHRFPIDKYILVRDQLLYQGLIVTGQVHDPGLIDEAAILLVHTPSYWQQIKTLTLDARAVRRIGLPLMPVSVNRARSSVAGTLQAALSAIEMRVSMSLAGGTHHAYADHGEGFSLLNDIAIASMRLLEEKKVTRILIVDLDVHQGNGNAHFFAGKPEVFTFSMHGKDNYPLNKEHSDLDIALPTGTEDAEYLRLLSDTLPKLIGQHQPDFIFYQSGVDVLATDKLGKLSLTKQGCQERDRIVFRESHRHHIPVAITMGGGYSARMADIVDAHCNTYQAALEIFG